MGKLSIQDIAKVLVAKNGLEQQQANHFATELFAIIQERLEKNDLVKVKGLGTFKVITVEARESVSVRTGGRVMIDEHSKITFTPDATMKELVNKPFSQFETVVLNDNVVFDDMKEQAVDNDYEEEPPLVEEEVPLIEEEAPVIAEEAPVIAEEAPVIAEETPLIEEPVVNDEEPEEAPSMVPLIGIPEDTPEESPEEAPEESSEETPQETSDETPEETSEETLEETPEESSDKTPEETHERHSDRHYERHYDSHHESHRERHHRRHYVYDDEELDDERGTSRSWVKWLCLTLGVLVLMGLSAIGGYYCGCQQMPITFLGDTVFVKDTVYIPESKDTASVETVKKTETVQDAPKTEEAKAEPVQEQVDKYAQKDERVRLGAYRIVGLDHEVKVLEGQTFYSICRAHLGPDMECYIEVYNDLPRDPQVKAGQVIKIPKLQLKKRKKQ